MQAMHARTIFPRPSLHLNFACNLPWPGSLRMVQRHCLPLKCWSRNTVYCRYVGPETLFTTETLVQRHCLPLKRWSRNTVYHQNAGPETLFTTEMLVQKHCLPLKRWSRDTVYHWNAGPETLFTTETLVQKHWSRSTVYHWNANGMTKLWSLHKDNGHLISSLICESINLFLGWRQKGMGGGGGGATWDIIPQLVVRFTTCWSWV